MEEDAGETRIPNPPASRPNGQGNDFDMLPTWAWRLTLAWVARGPLKVARECDPGMRQEFASESKPKTGSNASVSLTKRTQFNRGAGKSLNIVFSRGLRAARTGGVVAAIPFACHTVRRRQRKNLLPNNPPLGFSLGTVTTTETLSTEATPEHHRGCFNAPKFPRRPRLHTVVPAKRDGPTPACQTVGVLAATRIRCAPAITAKTVIRMIVIPEV